MLAYSSIAHAGYIMIGMLALNNLGLASVSFYMFAYLFANMGAFAVVAIFEDKTGSTQIASYAGLSKTSPFFAAGMAAFLLSLAGIPPLAGFLAKYYVFAAAISLARQQNGSYHWLYWLVGIGLITSCLCTLLLCQRDSADVLYGRRITVYPAAPAARNGGGGYRPDRCPAVWPPAGADHEFCRTDPERAGLHRRLLGVRILLTSFSTGGIFVPE